MDGVNGALSDIVYLAGWELQHKISTGSTKSSVIIECLAKREAQQCEKCFFPSRATFGCFAANTIRWTRFVLMIGTAASSDPHRRGSREGARGQCERCFENLG